MAKNKSEENLGAENLNPPEQSNEHEAVYESETPKRGKAAWMRSRPAKITGIAVGGTIALSAAFAGGALAAGPLLGSDGFRGPSHSSDGGSFAEGKVATDFHEERRAGGHVRGDERGGEFGSRAVPPLPMTPDPSTDSGAVTP